MHSSSLIAPLLSLSFLLVPACAAEDPEGGSSFGSGLEGEGDGDGDGDDVGDEDGDEGGDGDESGSPLLDVAGGNESGGDGGTESEGCEKVDFLFVIDHSGSMDDDQANLIQNFPGFMDAIETTLDVADFHVMVVDSDAGGMTHPECYAFWDEIGDPYHLTPCPYPNVPAGADPQLLQLWDECDGTIGAGVDMPLGFDASNLECNFASGKRWIDENEPDLSSAFSCAARVGTGGNNGERPAEALISSVRDDLLAPGGCNEGFLRDDALLVVTLLTDEQDVTSDPKKDPEAWAQAVVDAKNGQEDHVVMLGLLGGVEYPEPYLENMVNSFTYGQVESVTLPNYQPFFEQVVGEIDVACDEFVPPG